MIEAKDILALCDRFEAYLMPLDIYVVRQRYNGRIFKSTYTVGREMGISDETVRTIENRALDALAHCVDLEDAGQVITPMRLAKSFRQPIASAICAGDGRVFTSAIYTAHRGELIIFASSKPIQRSPFSDPLKTPLHNIVTGLDYPMGAIIGRCLVVDCFRTPLPQSLTPINGRSSWSNLRRFLSPFPTARAVILLHQQRSGAAATAAGRVSIWRRTTQDLKIVGNHVWCDSMIAILESALDHNAKRLQVLEAELAKLKGALVAAAGELMIEIPEPGTDMARVMIANSIMRQQRDAANAHAKQQDGELHTVRRAYLHEKSVANTLRPENSRLKTRLAELGD